MKFIKMKDMKINDWYFGYVRGVNLGGSHYTNLVLFEFLGGPNYEGERIQVYKNFNNPSDFTYDSMWRETILEEHTSAYELNREELLLFRVAEEL